MEISDLGLFWQSALVLFVMSWLFGLYSPLVVTGRQAYLGEAMGHSSFLGLAFAQAFLLQSSGVFAFLVATLITCLSAAVLAKATQKIKDASDSLIGIYLVTTVSLGVLIHQKWSDGRVDLMGMLFGDILLIAGIDVFFAILFGLVAFLCYHQFNREWKFAILNPNLARLSGVHLDRNNLVLIICLTLIILIAVKLAGSLVVNSLLLIPGLFALEYSKNLRNLAKFSLLFSSISSLMALTIGIVFVLPMGPTIALTQFGCLIIAKIHNLYLKKETS